MPLLSLSFWPEGPKLNEQLTEQGLKFDKKKVKTFEQRIEFINNALICGNMSHADGFNTAKALADEINTYVQTYVEPEVPVKKKASKKEAKKASKKEAKKTTKKTDDKNRSKKPSKKGKRS